MVDEYPKIRNVEPLPIMIQGQQMIALRDPHNLAEEDKFMVMTAQTFFVVTLFNGNNSISDIQTFLTRAYGGLLFPREDIVRIVEQLDEHFLLENDRVQEKLEAYRRATVRKSILSGRNLPVDSRELNDFMANILQLEPDEDKRQIRALVSPHIDISRGKASFAKAYRPFEFPQRADIYVIFGTAHYAVPDTRFVFTHKPYETPYGLALVDTAFVSKVASKTGIDLFSEELIHKGEHSIESQVLFLQHTIAKHKPIQIVPILVGPLHDCMTEGTSPMEDAEIHDVLMAIRETSAELGKERVCWIAGVDFSHVGRRFGDEKALDESLLGDIRAVDMEAIQQILQVNPKGFFEALSRHGNRYRICGMAPIYALLQMIEGEGYKGNLLNYEQSIEQETVSVVTFATINFVQ